MSQPVKRSEKAAKDDAAINSPAKVCKIDSDDRVLRGSIDGIDTACSPFSLFICKSFYSSGTT